MCILRYFVERKTKDVILERKNTVDEEHRGKEGKLKSYGMLFDNLLRMYATYFTIYETDVEINRSNQGNRIYSTEYAQELWTMVLKCGTMYSENRQKCILTEVLHGLIKKIRRG